MALGIRGLHKEVKQFIAQVQPRGWEYDGTTKKGHVKLRHHSGVVYIIPGTASDHRSQLNADRHMARIERGDDPRYQPRSA